MTVSIPVELLDNLPACHAIILRQAEVIVQLEARLDRFQRDLTALKRQLFGLRRERFVAGSREDPVGEDVAVEPCVSQGESPAVESRLVATPPRTSKGRQKRVIDASIPREKVLHRLDEQNIPPELLNADFRGGETD